MCGGADRAELGPRERTLSASTSLRFAALYTFCGADWLAPIAKSRRGSAPACASVGRRVAPREARPHDTRICSWLWLAYAPVGAVSNAPRRWDGAPRRAAWQKMQRRARCAMPVLLLAALLPEGMCRTERPEPCSRRSCGKREAGLEGACQLQTALHWPRGVILLQDESRRHPGACHTLAHTCSSHTLPPSITAAARGPAGAARRLRGRATP